MTGRLKREHVLGNELERLTQSPAADEENLCLETVRRSSASKEAPRLIEAFATSPLEDKYLSQERTPSHMTSHFQAAALI